MERDVDHDREPHDADDVTVDDVTLTSSVAVMSKFLRELKIVSSLAWPTVILSYKRWLRNKATRPTFDCSQLQNA